jgi:hypothetical protein
VRRESLQVDDAGGGFDVLQSACAPRQSRSEWRRPRPTGSLLDHAGRDIDSERRPGHYGSSRFSPKSIEGGIKPLVATTPDRIVRERDDD